MVKERGAIAKAIGECIACGGDQRQRLAVP
jgi:hypothetical protein